MQEVADSSSAVPTMKLCILCRFVRADIWGFVFYGAFLAPFFCANENPAIVAGFKRDFADEQNRIGGRSV